MPKTLPELFMEAVRKSRDKEIQDFDRDAILCVDQDAANRAAGALENVQGVALAQNALGDELVKQRRGDEAAG